MALTILVSAATLSAQSALSALPSWMMEFLPKTAEEKAKAAIFDGEGSRILQLNREVMVFACGGMLTDGEPTPYLEFATQLACGYDAVVLGTPTPSAVRTNNRGTWLYTEHAVKVRRWVSPAAETAAEIEVVTSGGLVYVDGQTTAVTTNRGTQLEASTEVPALPQARPRNTRVQPREGGSHRRRRLGGQTPDAPAALRTAARRRPLRPLHRRPRNRRRRLP